MGKRSGITKSGRVMNPADRERKQQRAKELKRNKKQRNEVRKAIVKGRDPEDVIEQMSRLDDQEFDPQRQLSLNVLQEKRYKLRGSFIQILSLHRQEKNEKRIKDLERMMFEYELERSKKEENFRAKMFSENADFEAIPLPVGAGAPDAAKTPFVPQPIGPQVPVQLQAAMKVGILKKSSAISAKKHKHPPGPPPGLPILIVSDDDEDNQQDQEEWREGSRRRRVRFDRDYDRTRRGRDGDEAEDEEEEEDYAPVEIPESMMSSEGDQQNPQQHHRQSLYSSGGPIPSLAAPTIGPPATSGSGVAMPPPPGMAAYPPEGFSLAPNMPPEIHAQALRTGRMPFPPTHRGIMGPPQQQFSKMGLINNFPSEPHPSAVISAEPQVVKPHVNIPQSAEAATTIISAAPQMRDIKREATRFVPTAVKIQRPVVPTVIGPKIPSSSVAGPTKLVPRGATTAMRKKAPMGVSRQQQQRGAGEPTRSVDEACDEFLKELEGFL